MSERVLYNIMWKVGVIGLGSFGQKRLQALLELPDIVESIVLYDEDLTKLQKVFHSFNSKKMTTANSLKEIFADPLIDAIFICTPNFTHAELCASALSNSKHVLCEKPISNSTEVITQLSSLAKKKNKILKAGTNHRYFPSIQKLLQTIQDGQIGEVLSFHGNIGTNGKRIQNSWFWKKDLSTGGTFLDNGHHLLDLAVLCCGSFSECLGHSSQRVWSTAEVEDYAVAIYRQETKKNHTGYEAVIRSSWRQPTGYLDIEVWGTKGSIKASMSDKEIFQLQTEDNAETIDFTLAPKDSLHQSLRLFFSMCEHPTKNISAQSNHLLQLTKMIEAFYTSTKVNSWVKV